MIVEPYRRPPTSSPSVAYLGEDGRVTDEHGDRWDADNLPEATRLWVSEDVAGELVAAGRGEALCWRNQEVRWRHARLDEEGWKPRRTDALVLGLPLEDLPTEEVLRGLARWRDWLWSYGAVPGTTGSASWSLLRTRLERKILTGSGKNPPLRFTVGGRQELGPRGAGRFEHGIAHLDMSAAYASTLAHLRYGGEWRYEPAGPLFERKFERWAREPDYPAFVRARVRIGDGWPGPLLRRPRRMEHRAPILWTTLYGADYPTEGRLQGFWTWQELEAAQLHGTRIEKVYGGWIHRAGSRPFLPWWAAIEHGREMPGLAGTLAKLTGNALWGRFCMDPRQGRRTIQAVGARGRPQTRRMPSTGYGQWPGHDLAETVSGRVRARLFLAMREAGPDLLTAHTDGLWVDGSTPRIVEQLPELRGWRVKDRARAIEILGPQALRYWPRRAADPTYVVAGVPSRQVERIFNQRWARRERA